MVQTVPISAVPNQEFTITLNNQSYDITIKSTNGVMAITISRSQVVLVENLRCVAGGALLPYRYLEDGQGNFLFLTANFELPDYTKFNVTQSLVYLEPTDLVALRTPPTFPLPASFFNPIAALPARFKPIGYQAT